MPGAGGQVSLWMGSTFSCFILAQGQLRALCSPFPGCCRQVWSGSADRIICGLDASSGELLFRIPDQGERADVDEILIGLQLRHASGAPCWQAVDGHVAAWPQAGRVGLARF